MANILVFGASTTYGAWDEEGGWVQRLRKYLDKKVIESNYQLDHTVYNLGISGDDTEGLLKRLEFEAKSRIDPEAENILMLSIGINDSIYVHDTRSTKLTPQDYRKNLQQIISIFKKFSEKIVLVGSMPVDKRVDPIPWLQAHSYKNEYVKEFNIVMEEVAQAMGLGFVDVFNKFIDQDYSRLLADGVHPNSKGHEAVYQEVKNYLMAGKLIS